MARPLRIEFPGALYHVLARGNERKAVFRDDADREFYLRRLAHYRGRYGKSTGLAPMPRSHFTCILPFPGLILRAVSVVTVALSFYSRVFRLPVMLFPLFKNSSVAFPPFYVRRTCASFVTA